MWRDKLAEFTLCSRTSPKFMIAMLGPKKNTVWLQRGYRHYGQPVQETLDAIVEVVEDKTDPWFVQHVDRMCTCGCQHCSAVSPHSVQNCFYKCKDNLKMDDATMKKLGMFETCMCQCQDCIRMPEHKKSHCYEFCGTSPFTK